MYVKVPQDTIAAHQKHPTAQLTPAPRPGPAPTTAGVSKMQATTKMFLTVLVLHIGRTSGDLCCTACPFALALGGLPVRKRTRPAPACVPSSSPSAVSLCTTRPQNCTLAASPAAGAAAAAGRDLQSTTLPTVALPPIAAFLPAADSVSIMPLNQFLAEAGLPSWDELGLPPISELLKPVGGPQGAKLPSPAQIAAQANSVFNDVMNQLLPSQVKGVLKFTGLASGGLRTVNATAVAKSLNITLPPALANARLPINATVAFLKLLQVPGTQSSVFAAMVNATNNLQAAWNQPIVLPPLALPKGVQVPSLDQLVAAISKAVQLANATSPKNSQLPTLQQTVSVLSAINSALTKVQAATGGATASG